ncbi:MAG: type II toxin-antitoxin system RelE/ParE family toxin [Myxococcota bacterium]
MVDVVGTDEFAGWYDSLNDADTEAVTLGVDRLAAAGVTLQFPYCSAIEGTDYPLRELRIQSKGRPIRVFYAFDPRRHAVLLIGGDKTGDDRFYDRMVPRAEGIWESYLDEIDN